MSSPIIPWIGGKRRLAPEILPLLADHKCYVELFCGAAAIFFMKQPSEVEVLNDVNGELINMYRVVKHHVEEFVRQFKWSLSSRLIYKWTQETPPETLTDIQRAARFFYLQKLAFGARVAGQSFGTSTTAGPRISFLTLEQDLSDAYLRLAGATIEHLDWRTCLTRYDRPHTAFFADPPYWETEGYGVEFGIEQYEALAAAAKTMQGRIIITVNDHPKMREVFAGLPQKTVGIKYSVGGGGHEVDRQELIIGNWPGGWPAAAPLTSQTSLADSWAPSGA